MTFNFYTLSTFLPLLLLFSSPFSTTSDASKSSTSTYIVHTNSLMRPFNISTQDDWYSSLLESLTETEFVPTASNRVLYIYDTVLNGFAGVLTSQEAEKMAAMPGVIGVHEDKMTIKLHTTHTPDFLGLNVNYGLWPENNYGDGVIIGIVDSGIWPESDSFSDHELGPIGPHWKGECEEGTQFNSSHCNNKIIGARFFCKGMEAFMGRIEGYGEYRSPRDGVGHGTHTASTAAGAEVANANMLGFANGSARGIATKARISVYKACWWGECTNSDIIAAMENAIKDGVDVLSVSLGSSSEEPYHKNAVLIGAFAAAKKQVFVACSAGNSGSKPFSVVNAAPWVTTVGAGSVDRTFPAQVQLGSGEVLVGESLYNEKIQRNSSFPLVYSRYCDGGDIIPDNVMGTIVVCNMMKNDAVEAGFLVAEAGGVGLITLNTKSNGEGIMVEPFTIPALTLGYKDGLKLRFYMNSTKNPTATFKFEDQTVVGKDRAPMVTSFSSRGPNLNAPHILKPDILAPGFNILAAWVDDKSPTLLPDDTRRVKYNIISGTSMACPHVAGVAALLIKAHPTWSPAAIRSAMMTSSATFDEYFRPIAEEEDLLPATFLGLGAGQILPQKAAYPGLVYDADVSDYINFLCTLNYTKQQLSIIVNGKISCSGNDQTPGNLNYPSFSVVFNDQNNVHVLKRTLTNIEELPETYTVRVFNPRPEKVEIVVNPKSLTFSKVNERQSYSAVFKSNFVGNSSHNDSTAIVHKMEFGYIIWESDQHSVRSPVSLMWNNTQA